MLALTQLKGQPLLCARRVPVISARRVSPPHSWMVGGARVRPDGALAMVPAHNQSVSLTMLRGMLINLCYTLSREQWPSHKHNRVHVSLFFIQVHEEHRFLHTHENSFWRPQKWLTILVNSCCQILSIPIVQVMKA